MAKTPALRNPRSSKLFRDSASGPQLHRPEMLYQPEEMLLMLLSLIQDMAIYLPLNQATACLPVTEMVSRHAFPDRRTDPRHCLLPDKTDITGRINCSHSSLTAAVAFISYVLSLLVVCSWTRGQ